MLRRVGSTLSHDCEWELPKFYLDEKKLAEYPLGDIFECDFCGRKWVVSRHVAEYDRGDYMGTHIYWKRY